MDSKGLYCGSAINALYVTVYVWSHTALYLWLVFVCRVIDTLANIYAPIAVMRVCLFGGGCGGPVKIFAPHSVPVMVMRVRLSCDKTHKQASDKPTNKHLEDKNTPGSVRSELHGNDLLRWGPKLFVLPHDEVGGRTEQLSSRVFVCLRVWLSFVIISDSAGCAFEAWGDCHQAPCPGFFLEINPKTTAAMSGKNGPLWKDGQSICVVVGGRH